jgi:hypothetical protein
MGTIIAFPTERRATAALFEGDRDGSVIILPVIRVERHGEQPADGFEPSSSSPRGRRRKR